MYKTITAIIIATRRTAAIISTISSISEMYIIIRFVIVFVNFVSYINLCQNKNLNNRYNVDTHSDIHNKTNILNVFNRYVPVSCSIEVDSPDHPSLAIVVLHDFLWSVTFWRECKIHNKFKTFIPKRLTINISFKRSCVYAGTLSHDLQHIDSRDLIVFFLKSYHYTMSIGY